MSDLRWSFDSRTDELDVWDSKNGTIQHYDRCGADGYVYCSQGRIYPNEAIYIYGNRPMRNPEGTTVEELKAQAKDAVIDYLKERGYDASLPWVTIY